MRTLTLALALVAGLTPRMAVAVDHRLLDAILKKHVKHGRVDYAGIKRDSRAKLDGYVAALANANLGSMRRNDKLAFYLNAYNALVLKAVVDRLPVKSVMKVPGFFKRLKHTVAGKRVTLDQLENKTIRPSFKDARIHFALVCAARSCPPLRSAAFFGGSVDKVLERLAGNYINSWHGVRVQGDKIRVSQIFKWYAADFSEGGSVGAYLARYHRKHAKRLTGATQVAYLPYDWSLNTQ